MSVIEKQLREIDKLNILQQRNHWVNRLHPMVKLCLTISYIVIIVSCHRYQLTAMILLAIYPFMMFNLSDLSFRAAIYRVRLILPVVLVVGIFNPLIDKSAIMHIGGVTVTGGVVSMITLMLKGLYAVLASYLLIATTTIEDICDALNKLHMPRLLVTVIMLMERYIHILGKEASHIMTAYSLRAPSQKGIHYRAWGPLVGMWLLRSMERARVVYEGMILRGYNGDFNNNSLRHLSRVDVLFFSVWLIVCVAIRIGV